MKLNLALFDFDGTISSKDSVELFLKFVNNKWFYYYVKFILTLHLYILYKLGMINYQKLKNDRLYYLLKGLKESEIFSLANDFSINILPNILRRSALNRLEWHLSNKDEIYVVSASFDILLDNWCKSKKINLITNKFDFKRLLINDIFQTPDCNGDEKVNRIKQIVKLEHYDIIYAYGDSKMDLPMLNIANKKYFKFFKD
jgi:HAD superfamily phosphoserine phosphatase-like hydrolase